VDHSGAVSLSADCAACHDGTQGLASGMVVDPANDKVHDACATCHGSDGTLVGSAAGNTAPNECVDCHGAYFPNHSHVHDVRFDAALDLGQPSSTPCANCHNDNGGSLATWNDIYVEHLSSCDTCHAYTDADGQGTPPLSTVQNTIATGTAVHCLTCHTPKTAPAGHGGHPQPDVIAQKAAACTVCHDNDPSAPKAVVNDIHKGDCNNCHDASSGPPTLRNPVPPNAVAIVRGGDCVTCHGSGYTHDVFEAGTSHSKITFGDPALPGVDTSTCGACHSTRANGSADAEAIHMTDAKAGGRTWACEICHNNPEFNGLISDAINGTGVYASRPGGAVYCTDCHEYNDGVNPTLTPYAHVFPHGNRRHNIQGINNCVVCHSDLDVINGIHIPGAVSGSNSCDTCHGSTDPNVSATIAAGGGNCGDCHGEQYVHTYAGAPAHDITVNGASCAGCHTVGTFSEIVATHRDTCATCHGSSDPTVQNVIANANGGNVGCLDCHSGAGAAHHASAKAQAGLCETCHDNSQVGPTVANIRQLACVVCHVDANANGVAIVSLRLSKITGSEPTSLVNANATVGSTTTDANGYLASHRINSGSPIKIADFRACFDCHSGNNPNYPAAPVIAPFHGFPGDLSLEHIAYRDSSGKTVGTNRTIIGGGSVLVADENNNGDALPRVFMNEHPGHKHFRRFAANMRARSSKNGYSDNERLYDGNPYNNRNATNSALNTTVDVLFHKGGVTFANGFDPCQEAGKCGGNFGTDMVPLSGYDLTIATVPHTRFGTNLGTNFKNVPYMPNIPYPALPDDVTITLAEWDGSTLTVEATNTAPNETLSVWYDGNNLGDMTEVVEGSWTFSAPLASLPVPDVEVHTTSSLGVNATKTITDTSVPTPATAVDDNLSAAASGVTNLDVLANDSGTAISIISVTQPSLGSVAIAGGGSSIDYTGAGAGNTSFTYTIQGSTGGPSTATVNLTVTVNQPPAFGSASYTAPNATEGQAYSTTVAQDATDPEGDPITYSDNGAGTTCTWTSVAADGTISGTPGAGDVGSCVVRVKATATGGSDTADVNITVDPAPSGDTSYSNSGQTITLYSDAGYSNPIDVKNTVLSTGTTYYVEVTSTTVKDASNKNQLRVNDAYGNRPVDTTFKQTSTSSPYTYRQSFSVNAPGVYSIEAQVDDGNNTCKIAGLDFVVGGGEYIKTYSDSSYTTESTTFAVGQTVYVEAYSAAFTDGTPDAGQSKVDVGDFVNGKTNPNISVSKAGTKTYRMSFTMPAGYGSSGEYVGLKIRWKDSGGTTLGKPEMVVKIQ